MTKTFATSSSKGIWSGIGSVFSSYAKGDLIYASGTDVISKLAIGAEDTVLTSKSGVSVWLPPADQLPSIVGNAGKFLTTDGTVKSWAALSGWSTTGNAGTDGGTTNFVGTTDNKNVMFKRNNVSYFYLDTGNITHFDSDIIMGQRILLSNGGGSPYIQSLGGVEIAFKAINGATWLQGNATTPKILTNNFNIGGFNHFQFSYGSTNIATLKGGGD